jgi:hypothetical protein
MSKKCNFCYLLGFVKVQSLVVAPLLYNAQVQDQPLQES